jgi:hypothetical protein
MSRVMLDKIIDEVKTLSADERRELRSVLDQTVQADEIGHRQASVRAVKGKYADLGLSSEDFAASKAREIELEDRPR